MADSFLLPSSVFIVLYPKLNLELLLLYKISWITDSLTLYGRPEFFTLVKNSSSVSFSVLTHRRAYLVIISLIKISAEYLSIFPVCVK